ncbi:hypothetical protein L345_11133, partial [Ophiophagus hannah]
GEPKERGEGGFSSTDPATSIIATITTPITFQQPRQIIVLQGKPFEGILDTGVDVSVISAKWWPDTWPTEPCPRSLDVSLRTSAGGGFMTGVTSGTAIAFSLLIPLWFSILRFAIGQSLWVSPQLDDVSAPHLTIAEFELMGQCNNTQGLAKHHCHFTIKFLGT